MLVFSFNFIFESQLAREAAKLYVGDIISCGTTVRPQVYALPIYAANGIFRKRGRAQVRE
jgi:hypothetical protein